MSIEEERIIVSENMYKYGGSFVKKLGDLLVSADGNNLRRIKLAWPEYWEEYLNNYKKGKEMYDIRPRNKKIKKGKQNL